MQLSWIHKLKLLFIVSEAEPEGFSQCNYLVIMQGWSVVLMHLVLEYHAFSYSASTPVVEKLIHTDLQCRLQSGEPLVWQMVPVGKNVYISK